jgi:hypothetical protein
MRLTFGWWNTGLSPTKNQNRASLEELQAASTVLRVLLHIVKIDFLALGEVSQNDVETLQHLLGNQLQDYSVLPTQEKAGRSYFDTSVIHHNRLRIAARESVIRWKLERATRVAQRFDVEIPGDRVFRTFVSHWPSRGRLGAWEPDRMMLGNLLRQSVDLVLEEDQEAPIILLGDYNDEPFDPVMDNALLSSRDRKLVSRTPSLLYNPFWRHMTCYEHADDGHQFSDRGTYFHAGGHLTQWRTFDQMMFSASLLNGNSGWLLDEHATRVVDVPHLEKLLEEKSTVFDHMPIVGRLQRNQVNV